MDDVMRYDKNSENLFFESNNSRIISPKKNESK